MRERGVSPWSIRGIKPVKGEIPTRAVEVFRNERREGLRLAMRSYLLSLSIGIREHEVTLVWHLDLRQGLRVHDGLFRDDPVQAEQVRGERINFRIGQRMWRRIRHRAAHVIEHRCCIRPVAPNRFYGTPSRERPLPSNESIVDASG